MQTTLVFCHSISRLFHNIIGCNLKKSTKWYYRTLKCLSRPCIAIVRDMVTPYSLKKSTCFYKLDLLKIEQYFGFKRLRLK